MTDYSSSTPQDFTVTDLSGGDVWTHGLVNTGGSGTSTDPFSWQAALSATGTGQFTLHYWRSGSTNNWGHTSRTDITSTVSNGVVTVTYSGTAIFTFTESDAFVASGSSGGGTSTEGSSGPSGSSYVNSNGQIVFVINGTSPSSDANVVYKIFRRPVGGIFEQAYVVSHTSGTSPADDTDYNVGSGTGYSRWELRVESSTGLVSSGVLAWYSFSKKAFCNFW